MWRAGEDHGCGRSGVGDAENGVVLVNLYTIAFKQSNLNRINKKTKKAVGQTPPSLFKLKSYYLQVQEAEQLPFVTTGFPSTHLQPHVAANVDVVLDVSMARVKMKTIFLIMMTSKSYW